jgi:acetoin utilization deacetylase AcuC-like enzyme
LQLLQVLQGCEDACVVAPSPIARLRRLLGGDRPPVYYDPAYRLPLPAFEGQAGVEPRRADYVVWYLREKRVLQRRDLRTPTRIGYEALSRVHTAEFLESLTLPETLARIYAAEPSEVPVDELLASVRLACGGTLGAARDALARGGPAVNLLGGFHHAAPDRGGGLCPVNDIAVAIAALRSEGLAGRVVVLDLDAHPPDGTAACLGGDPDVWIGSLSGSDWGGAPGVDETVLPPGTEDEPYLGALDQMLGRMRARMPAPALAFVLAGGDVLRGDLFGRLALSLDGARRRDLRVAEALAGVPSVWLPGGGYHPDAWKVLAGTVMALVRRTRRPVPPGYDPLHARFAWIAAGLGPEHLSGSDAEITDEDLADSLGLSRSHRRLLHYYSAEGVEYGLFRYGLLSFLGRLGYEHFRIALGRNASGGEFVRVYARSSPTTMGHREGSPRDAGRTGGPGVEHLLVDCAVERMPVEGHDVLYLHWLTLRNPRAHFSDERPRLPGQEVPGLGVSREIIEVLGLMAQRLGLEGLAFRPSWYHTAYPGRHRFRFIDPARQGRFEALMRDLAGVPLRAASEAIATERVLLDGQPYRWEADAMVYLLAGPPVPADDARIVAARDACHFVLLPAVDRPPPGK